MIFLYFSLIIILGKELLNFDEERLVVISLFIFVFLLVLNFRASITNYFDSKINNIVLLYKLFLNFKIEILEIIINYYKKNALVADQINSNIILLDRKLEEFQRLNGNLAQIFWSSYIFNQLKTIVYEQELLKQTLQISLVRYMIISF
jgi:hypothetical protein